MEPKHTCKQDTHCHTIKIGYIFSERFKLPKALDYCTGVYVNVVGVTEISTSVPSCAVRRPEDNFWQFSPPTMQALGIELRWPGLSGKHLYPLCHLSGPASRFKDDYAHRFCHNHREI